MGPANIQEWKGRLSTYRLHAVTYRIFFLKERMKQPHQPAVPPGGGSGRDAGMLSCWIHRRGGGALQWGLCGSCLIVLYTFSFLLWCVIEFIVNTATVAGRP